MPGRPQTTARRIELGHELRQLRLRTGLTLEEAVRGLPLSDTKLYRVETGMQDLRNAADLRKLLARYQVTDEESVQRLLDILRSGSEQEWWARFRGAMPSGMPRFIGVETAAVEIQAFHPCLVLGLLQTEEYARAVHQVAKPVEDVTNEFIEEAVRVRMLRKQPLLREESPLRLRVVLWEPALRYVVGGPQVMRKQYHELTAMAARENVTLQILPLHARGYLAQHDFTILHLGGKLPTTVQVDNAWSAASVSDKPREVAKFSRKFDALVASCLPPDDTPAFLHRLAREVSE